MRRSLSRPLRRSPASADVSFAAGWSSAPTPGARARRRVRGHLPVLLMLVPLVVGLLGAPAGTPVVRGDELADAKAKQEQLKEQIAKQKAEVAKLNDLQDGLAAEIRDTKRQLSKINADLAAVRKKIDSMEAKIAQVKAVYDDLVLQLRGMDVQLTRVIAQEAAKRTQLTERRALLAERVRSAYDSERTSPLEAFLSGATFTDVLAEMSYYIDVGEQDQALARQIRADQEALAVLHQTVADTRTRTNELRQQTAAQKRELDRRLEELKAAKRDLKKLERQTAKALRQQQATYSALSRNKKAAARIIAAAADKQRALAKKIDALIAKQVARGNIPSRFNGTMDWPMSGSVSGEYGCSTFEWYAPGHGCDHFHNGIDIVAPYGTKVRAAAKGTVVYIGWNWADGADPAWIVVIAHSSSLKTWYAHMQPKRPVEVGEVVSKGQVIGYEGNTGNSTGAHLHWMVERNGDFVNPRAFL
ncbi:MAG TPA: peptidoglycan DD-metalloendopeptidase family protein [Candidatus Limnocylindria bacterium]